MVYTKNTKISLVNIIKDREDLALRLNKKIDELEKENNKLLNIIDKNIIDKEAVKSLDKYKVEIDRLSYLLYSQDVVKENKKYKEVIGGIYSYLRSVIQKWLTN